MIITQIKRKGRSESYHVYVDDEYFGIIEYDFIYRYKLKEGTEIDKDKLLKIQIESDNFICSSYALKYISKRFCSEYDLRRYLKKLKFSSEGITNAIKKLKEYGYLDDEKWSERVANNLKSCHGKRYIKQQLQAKGIEDDSINNILDNIGSEEEACLDVAKRWIRMHGKLDDVKNKTKLMRFLGARGFDFGTIRSVLINLNEDVSDLDDWNWFSGNKKN